MTLETLKVVIEATTKPYRDAMKQIREETKKSMSEVDKQKEKIRRMMDVVKSTTKVEPDKGVAESQARLKKVLESIRTTMNEIQAAAGIKMPTESYTELTETIVQLEDKMDALRKKQAQLRESGYMVPTEEYKELGKCIADTEKKLNTLIAREDKMSALGADKHSKAWKSLQYDIEETRNTLRAYKSDLAELKNSGGHQEESREWRETQREIKNTREQLEEYKKAQQRMKTNGSAYKFNAPGMMAQFKKVSEGIKHTSGAFASLIQRFRNGVPWFGKTQKSMSGMGQTGRGLSGIFRTIGMTAKFMFASMAIMGTINAAKEGMQNLARYSKETNASLSLLMSSLTQLKNAFATAFAPILNVVTPILNSLIQMLVTATTAVGNFFAALTGQSVFVKAKKVQQDYAASLDKSTGSADKLKRSLMGFDVINKLDDTSSGGGGGTSGGLDPGDMFETVEIPNKFKDFAQIIKDAWSTGDFTDIGKMVGNKLNKALEGINWDSIQGTARNIASSIATLLNGFIEVTDWSLVGATLAEGLNTAIEFLYTFIKTFGWAGLGKAIAGGINGFVRTVDWKKAGLTLSNLAKGILEGLITALNEMDWEQIGKSIGTFLAAINWGVLLLDAGKAIVSAIRAAVETCIGLMETDPIAALIVAALAAMRLLNVSIPIKSLGIKILAVTIAWEGGMTLGKYIGNWLNGGESGTDWSWTDYSVDEWLGALGEMFGNWVQKIKDFFIGLPKWFKEKFDKAYEFVKKAFEGIGTWFKSRYEDVTGVFKSIGSWFREKFNNAYKAVKDAFKGIGNWFKDRYKDVTGAFSKVGGWFRTTFSGALTGIKNVFGPIKKWFGDVWASLKNTVSNTWDKILALFSKGGKIFSGVKDGIANVFRTIVQTMINGINKVIAMPFNGINGMLNKIRNTGIDTPFGRMAPFAGLWGVNPIPVPQIPALAKGAVIPPNAPFLAVLGDQRHGTNIEAPAGLIKDIVKKAVSEATTSDKGAGETVIHVHVELSEREVGKAVIRYANGVYKMTGNNPLLC